MAPQTFTIDIEIRQPYRFITNACKGAAFVCAHIAIWDAKRGFRVARKRP